MQVQKAKTQGSIVCALVQCVHALDRAMFGSESSLRSIQNNRAVGRIRRISTKKSSAEFSLRIRDDGKIAYISLIHAEDRA